MSVEGLAGIAITLSNRYGRQRGHVFLATPRGEHRESGALSHCVLYYTSSQHAPAVVDHQRLSGCDCGDRLVERQLYCVGIQLHDVRGSERGSVPNTDRHPCSRRRRGRKPVQLSADQSAAQKLFARADHHRALFRTNRDYVHRCRESARDTPPLSDRIAGEPVVLTYDGAAGGHDRSVGQGRRVGGKPLLEDPRVVSIGDKADLLTLRLFGDYLEAHCMSACASLCLVQRADGQDQTRQHRAIDSPQEIGLVLVVIHPAVQLSVHDARIMPGRYPSRIDGICLLQKVTKLGERVAPDARNRCAAAGVLRDKVVYHIVSEPGLQIQNVVRNPELLAHASRVVYRIERATGSVGHVFSVTEQLHCGADHIVALLDQNSRRDRGIDAARHRDQHPFAPHADSAAASWRALVTREGNTSRTRSMQASVVRVPRLMRIAALASSGPTPSAVSTCEGLILPL